MPSKEFFDLPKFYDDKESENWLSAHNHSAFDLFDRDDEWAALDKFLEDQRHFAVWAVVGPSGSGKTRLVGQWLRSLVDGGRWIGGFVQRRVAEPWRSWTPDQPTVIVIDYTYHFDTVFKAIVEQCKGLKEGKVRLILLDHVFPRVLREDFSYGNVFSHVTDENDFRQGHLYRSDPLDLSRSKRRTQIIKKMIAHRAEKEVDDPSVKQGYDHLCALAWSETRVRQAGTDEEEALAHSTILHPLFAALVGDLIRSALSGEPQFAKLSRIDLIDLYLSRSRRLPWSREEQDPEAKALGPMVGAFVSAATLSRGMSFRRLHTAFQSFEVKDSAAFQDASRRRSRAVLDLSNMTVSSDDVELLRPFEPDLLGESFFLLFLNDYGGSAIIQPVIDLLSRYQQPEEEEEAVSNILETLVRLAHNLANDDQNDQRVKQFWDALLEFLAPDNFPPNSLMRQAISIALVDVTVILRNADLGEPSWEFCRQVNLNDLTTATTGLFWSQAAAAFVKYAEGMARADRLTPALQEKLFGAISAFKERSADDWTGVILAATLGCSRILDTVHQELREDVNATTKEGWTALMAASDFGHEEVAGLLLDRKADVNQAMINQGWTALTFACQKGHRAIAALLLETGAYYDSIKFNGDSTAFVLACQYGHDAVVELLLGHGFSANAAILDNSWTALVAASFHGHYPVVELLLDRGADVNLATESGGFTALIAASHQGFLTIVELLLMRGAQADHVSHADDKTALLSACEQGHLNVIDCLLDFGADVNQSIGYIGCTALLGASEKGLSAAVALLLSRGADVDQATSDVGWTALMAACQQGFEEVVSVLLEAGADVNKATISEGYTALMAASDQGDPAVVTLLLEKGANVNQARVDSGWTALMASCQNGHEEVARRLLEKGAKANDAKTDNGQSALVLACQMGHRTIAEMLLNAGANVDHARTDTGATALNWACQNGHAEVVELLLEYGADADHRTHDVGLTPLISASQDGDTKIVALLLNRRADPNKRNNIGGTALLFACQAGHNAVAELLLEKDASANLATDKEGYSPLIAACSYGHYNAARLLLNYGADPNQEACDTNWTPLVSASQNGSEAIVNLLLNCNANINHTVFNGATSLMAACANGNTPAVRALLMRGADTCRIASDGHSAMSLARRGGYTEIVAMLEAADDR